jgi:hypothetical protein
MGLDFSAILNEEFILTAAQMDKLSNVLSTTPPPVGYSSTIDEYVNVRERVAPTVYAKVTEVKTPRQICADAAEYIMEHGWTQGRLQDETGSVCAVGAMHMAAFGVLANEDLILESCVNDRAYAEAAEMVTAAIRNLPGDLAYMKSIPSYNDQMTTTQEDILLILKKVAAGE